jgi:hypothetical protein
MIGRQDLARHVADRDGHLVAHVLGGHVDLAVQIECDDDDRGAGAADRAQLADPLDRVDLLLEPLRHVVSVSSMERPGSSTRTLTVGRSTAGKRSTPSRNQRGGAHDHERHDEHGREDRTLDADFGELLHGASMASRRG